MVRMAGVTEQRADTWRGLLVAVAVIATARWADAVEPATQPSSLLAVERYDVFEVVLTSTETFDNPFTAARASAEFTSPSGRKIEVPGFFYGGDRWMVRFVPDELGEWSYTARLVGAATVSTPGRFRCTSGDRHGFLRISKINPYRFQHDDGMPFYPIGVQTGGYFRVGLDTTGRGQTWGSVSAAEWCETFQGAVNLLRWQLDRGELQLIRPDGPLDRYDTELAARMDDLLRLQKRYGFCHIVNLFEDMSLWGNAKRIFGRIRDLEQYKSLQADNLPQQEAYLHYVVARFGCFVDVWELFNEDSFAPNDYLAHLAKVVRDADPYDHIITTNYARPDQDWCEIVTWHEYMGMPANQVDAYVAEQIGKFKSYGKLVQNTEFGNQGWLSSYDPVKWRIAVWTAFMNESGMLFWYSAVKSRGGRPYRGNANAYLGPESRQYFRVLNEFTRDLPVDMRPVECSYRDHNEVRVYALSNGQTSVVYLQHFASHSRPSAPDRRNRMYVHTGPGSFRITWIDPADGKVLRTDKVGTTQQYLWVNVYPVTIDLACRIDRVE